MSFPLTVLLDNGVPRGTLSFFDDGARTAVLNEFRTLLGQLSTLGKTFQFDAQWGVTGESLDLPNIVIIYFRSDRGDSLTKLIPGAIPPGPTAAGITVLASPRMSEVYVDGNMPGAKLAHIAAHEMLHNKTGFDDQQLHPPPQNGSGIAHSPTEEWDKVNSANAQLFGRFVDIPVAQFVRKWPAP
jgi:hypothetical protein